MLGLHPALLGGRRGEGGDVAGDAAEGVVVGPTDVEREADALRDRVDQARRHLDLADRPDGSRTGVAGQPLELEHALRQHGRRVETEVHGRGARVVAAAVDDHVACT